MSISAASLALPSGPGSPFGPYGPSRPWGPCGPATPWGPCGPFCPWGPCGPAFPRGPFSPRGLIGPCGPAGPISPLGPGRPTVSLVVWLVSPIWLLTYPIIFLHRNFSSLMFGVCHSKRKNIFYRWRNLTWYDQHLSRPQFACFLVEEI